MSRNIRQKTPVTPVQNSKRRASKASTAASSDDDYNGVDDISDSDEDEPDVNKAEEDAIIARGLNPDEYEAPSQPFDENDAVDWEGFADSPVSLPQETNYFEEQMARMDEPDYDTQAATFNATNEYESDSTVTPRRVRFQDVSSDDDSDIEVYEVFPDIFLDQDSLNPNFRTRIEQDNEDQFSSDGGQWDFDEQGSTASSQANDGDSDSSSGYDSEDEGDTTDEELPPEAIVPPKSVLRRGSTSSDDSDTSTEDIPVTHLRRQMMRTPRLGTWKTNRNMPIVMFDAENKKQVIGLMRRASSPKNGGVMGGHIEEPIEEMSPMLSNSANLMMSGIASSFHNFDNGSGNFGAPEAYYPFVHISSMGVVADSPSSNEMDDDDLDFDEDEDLWQVDDFIDFGDGASSAEEEDPSPSSDTAEPMSTPARSTTATSEEAHPLLSHFHNPSVVGAFRNHQRRHTALTRDNESHDSLAFSGPLHQGTLKGIKQDRFAAASKAITPRRKTLQQPIMSSPGSPLANMGLSRKRSFNGEDFMGHKRHRSAV